MSITWYGILESNSASILTLYRITSNFGTTWFVVDDVMRNDVRFVQTTDITFSSLHNFVFASHPMLCSILLMREELNCRSCWARSQQKNLKILGVTGPDLDDVMPRFHEKDFHTSKRGAGPEPSSLAYAIGKSLRQTVEVMDCACHFYLQSHNFKTSTEICLINLYYI